MRWCAETANPCACCAPESSDNMNNKSRAARLIAFGFAFATFAVAAQTLPPPQNVLQLSATGIVDVTQDLLVVSLTTTRDGPDAATVQSQLKAALDAALMEARK